MIVSIAELLILGIVFDWVFRKLAIPGLVGMLLLGVLLGPFALQWISPELLNVSNDFRLIALIVILLRAGFELSKETLNRVGGRVLLLSAVPAIIEGAAITLLGPPLLGLGYMESAILGSIVAAVSPAVVVPLMIRFMERGMGAVKGIPTMVLAASAIDDVFVIVVFSVFLGIYTGNSASIAWQLAGIPISILLGIVVGLVCGLGLFRLYRHFDPRATKRVLILLGLSVLHRPGVSADVHNVLELPDGGDGLAGLGSTQAHLDAFGMLETVRQVLGIVVGDDTALVNHQHPAADRADLGEDV